MTDQLPKMSPLCRSVTHDGRTVQVEIYVGDAGGWILEVVDEFNNSTLWDDEFESDRKALDEANRVILAEGIESLIGSAGKSVH